MKNKLLKFIIILTIFSGCKSTKDLSLIKVINKRDSKIYIDLWGYPAEGFPYNKAGAFYGIIFPDSSFIIELKDRELYQNTYDISPVYNTSEYEGFEVLIYQPLADETVFFGDTHKDTLYFERCDLKELIKNRPKIVTVK